MKTELGKLVVLQGGVDEDIRRPRSCPKDWFWRSFRKGVKFSLTIVMVCRCLQKIS
ncbi:MAG: hypothetical protein LBD58_12760 [Treponema sp.]|nr:hypothetical protein [Treponema sp.]